MILFLVLFRYEFSSTKMAAAAMASVKNKGKRAKDDLDDNGIALDNLLEKIPAKDSWGSDFILGVLILGSGF